jgi:hypothetical protein
MRRLKKIKELEDEDMVNEDGNHQEVKDEVKDL